MLEHTDVRKNIERYSIGFLVLVALIYGIFRTYPLIAGPQITIYNPHDGDTVSSTTFELSGEVLRVKEITIQGRPIPIGTDGHFAEMLMAQAPYTTIVIAASDFYGKTTVKTIRVIPE